MREIIRYFTDEDLAKLGVVVGRFLVSCDAYNFVVSEIHTVNDEESPGHGKKYIGRSTFHPSLKLAVNKILSENERSVAKDFTVVLKKHDEVMQHLERLTSLKRLK